MKDKCLLPNPLQQHGFFQNTFIWTRHYIWFNSRKEISVWNQEAEAVYASLLHLGLNLCLQDVILSTWRWLLLTSVGLGIRSMQRGLYKKVIHSQSAQEELEIPGASSGRRKMQMLHFLCLEIGIQKSIFFIHSSEICCLRWLGLYSDVCPRNLINTTSAPKVYLSQNRYNSWLLRTSAAPAESSKHRHSLQSSVLIGNNISGTVCLLTHLL